MGHFSMPPVKKRITHGSNVLIVKGPCKGKRCTVISAEVFIDVESNFTHVYDLVCEKGDILYSVQEDEILFIDETNTEITNAIYGDFDEVFDR